MRRHASLPRSRLLLQLKIEDYNELKVFPARDPRTMSFAMQVQHISIVMTHALVISDQDEPWQLRAR